MSAADAASAAPATATPVAGVASGADAGAARTETDIRDIRGPVAIASPWTTAVLVLGGLLGAVILLWLARRFWRRRAPSAPVPTPDEIALERLARAQSLMDPARAGEFSAAVTRAVRAYVEARFDVAAPRRTTEEFLRDLLETQKASLRSHASLLRDLLHHADLVKFARAPLTREQMSALHASARRFVLETRPPRPEAAASTGASASDGER